MAQDGSSESTQGKLSVALVVAGNLATIVSSVESIRSFIVSTIGVAFLRHLVILSAALILFGYVAAFSWIARRLFVGGRDAKAYAWGILGMLVAPAMLLANYAMLPSRVDPASVIKDKAEYWSDSLLSFQQSDGGVGGLPSDTSAGSQAWTTAQVVKGVLASGSSVRDPEAIRRALRYIETQRGSDGWPLYSGYTFSMTHIAAWVILADLEALDHGVWVGKEREAAQQHIVRDIDLLLSLQLPNGGWSPVPDGAVDTGRTYTSAMAIWALAEAETSKSLAPRDAPKLRASILRGIQWLLQSYSQKNGWAPNPSRAGQLRYYKALSAHVLFVLNQAERVIPLLAREPIYKKAKRDFLGKCSLDESSFSDDILQGSDSSIVGRAPNARYQIEGSTFLAYPWCVATFTNLLHDRGLTEPDRSLASEVRNAALLDIGDHSSQLGSDGNYEVAEHLFCLSYILRMDPSLKSLAGNRSLLAFLSSVVKALPLRRHQSLARAYVVALVCALMIFLALRIAIWRRRAPRLAKAKPDLPRTSVLLPVRDEEDNVSECLGSLLQQEPLAVVVVIDDNSSDRTPEILKRVAAENPHVVVANAGELPPHWKGKVHALEEGLKRVTTPWILSTDADTRHNSELLARALSTAQERQLDSVSIAGFQETLGLGENLLTPAIFGVLDGILGDWSEVANGESQVANGQFFLVKTESLRSIGGFASIRQEALDDVALARRLREGKFRHSFFRAPELLRVRMYKGLVATFRGWRRNLGAIFARRRSLAMYILFLLLFPAAVMLWGIVSADWGAVIALWLSGAAASMILRAGSGHPPPVGLLFPLDALTVAGCMSLGLLDASRGRLAPWKGRPVVLESP